MRHIYLRFGAILSFLAVLTLSSCAATLRSTVDTADHANLDGFKTYTWITDGPLFNSSAQAPEVVNPLNERRIRTTIEKELERKGYQKASLAQADIVVAFTLGARDRVRVQNYYDDFGYRYYGYYPGFSRFGRGYGGLGSSVSVRTFTEGTLVVDIFSNSDKEAIWHGSATERLHNHDSTSQFIDGAVTVLLAQFPDSGSRVITESGVRGIEKSGVSG